MGADGTHWELPECDRSDASLLTTPVCTFNIHDFVDEDKGDLAEGDLIQFRVAAVNEIETGEWSEYNTTGPVISTLPAKLSAVVTSNFGTNIVVSWNEPTDSGSTITQYHVLFPSTEVSMPEVAPEAIALDNATSKSQFDTTMAPSNALVDDSAFFASENTPDSSSSEWW